MNNRDIESLKLKNKLLIAIKSFLVNIDENEIKHIDKVIYLLKEKYKEDTRFLEDGIRSNIKGHYYRIGGMGGLAKTISAISTYVFKCNNEDLLVDLLECL